MSYEYADFMGEPSFGSENANGAIEHGPGYDDVLSLMEGGGHGTGRSRSGEHGTGGSGSGEHGTGDSGSDDHGTGDSGSDDHGTGDHGTGDGGSGDSGTGWKQGDRPGGTGSGSTTIGTHRDPPPNMPPLPQTPVERVADATSELDEDLSSQVLDNAADRANMNAKLATMTPDEYWEATKLQMLGSWVYGTDDASIKDGGFRDNLRSQFNLDLKAKLKEWSSNCKKLNGDKVLGSIKELTYVIRDYDGKLSWWIAMDSTDPRKPSADDTRALKFWLEALHAIAERVSRDTNKIADKLDFE
jgi:hypothetical protein